MKEIKENEFGNKIEKNDGIRIGLQKPTAVRKHQSDYVERKQGFEHHVDKKKSKFDIHVASILWEKKKGDSGGGVVDCVETKHKKMMQEVGNWLPGIKK